MRNETHIYLPDHNKDITEVDSQEKTTKFLQEIYNNQGKLVEIHEKYPIDKGHKKVN